MPGFLDYLKYYPNSENGPRAQYYIAEIYNRHDQFEDAAKAYDAVLERYAQQTELGVPQVPGRDRELDQRPDEDPDCVGVDLVLARELRGEKDQHDDDRDVPEER